MTTEQATTPKLDDDLLASRPRVRRDILFTEVPEGVLFHDATSGFRIHGRSAYRFATLVVPVLDGTTSVSDLCAQLGEQHGDMVVNLVRTLYRRGFARSAAPSTPLEEPVLADAVRRRFDAQVAYIDHHVDAADQRFAAFRYSRVAVVGDDEVAGWAARSLVRNGAAEVRVAPGILDAGLEREAAELRVAGCPVEVRADDALAGSPTWDHLDGDDVVVVTPSARAARTLLDLLQAGLPRGVVLLPCWQAGDDVLVGPSMRAGTVGCWMCAALRAGASGDPGSAADLWSGLAGHRAQGARRPAGPLAAMVGNLLAYEIFRLTTGALPGETDGTVVVQDQDSLDAVVEPLLPHPACGLCAEPEDGPGPDVPGSIAEVAEPDASPQSWKPMPEPGGPEAESQLATLRDRMALVGSRLGVVTGFDDDLLPQTPLRVTTVHAALGHGRRRRVAAVDVHNVAGARLSALATAAGVYADRTVPLTGVLTGRAAEAARASLPVVSPAELSTDSGVDPEGTTVTAWVRASSLTEERQVLVPAAAVAPYGDHNGGRVFTPGPAGTGVDPSAAGARGAALLSALAHDALVEALRGRRALNRLELGERDDDPVLTFLVRTASHLQVQPEVLDLGEDLPAPVVVVRAVDPRDGSAVWTVAADTTRRAATVVALRDLLGHVQLGAALPAGEPVDLGDPLVADLDPRILAVSADRPWSDRAVALPRVLDRMRGEGIEPLVVHRTAADLAAAGLSVARVLLARRRCEPSER